jgi:ketosteroid isomerase-like protein
MDEHLNARILRDMADRMKAGDMEGALDVLADDVEWHEIGRAEPSRGKQALAQRYAESAYTSRSRRTCTTCSPTTITRFS